jgi:hypothetical protein
MRSRAWCGAILICLAAAVAVGQGMPTATLTGKVTSQGGGLGGVTVTAESPQLPQKREAVTSSNGDYIFNLLPPGEYKIRFALAGMTTVDRTTNLGATQTARLDQELTPSAVTEAVVVQSSNPEAAMLENTTVSANYSSDFIEKLPTGRTIAATVLLAPGVSNNGPGGTDTTVSISISGAQSFESLFLINGVVVNENLRGQPHDLFIEDAVQETTILTGGVSAEYGRFSGGVVSAITKSGGNAFSGSFRTTFLNDDWTETSPFNEVRVDQVTPVYEVTLGGPFWKDHIWFFGAGRYSDVDTARQTQPTVLPGDQDNTAQAYTYNREQTRWEGKVTAALTPSHTVVGNYTHIADAETNNAFTTNILDLDSLTDRTTPNTLWSASYNGVMTNNFFVEAQYSMKEFTFESDGTDFRDRINGTLLLDQSRGNARWNSATFSSDTPEQRDNTFWYLKGSWFLSTASAGTHDVRFGYENFAESRYANNYQSGSDFRIFTTGAILRGTEVFPTFGTGDTTIIRWTPISERTLGTDSATHSIFVNDRIQLGRRWTFNAGVRWDKNSSVDSRGFTVADDSYFSPRLGAHFDPKGDGKLVMNASYGHYVAKLADSIGDGSSPAGQPATIDWYYRGPCINCNPNAPTSELIPTDEALAQLFAWFDGMGGTSSDPTRLVSIPGVSTSIFEGSLISPHAEEFTVGAALTLGTRGAARVDFIWRDYDDFYTDFLNLTTGQVTDEAGQTFDRTVIGNSESLDRRYNAIQTQFSWRPIDRLLVGGNYTWSRLTGNFDGETVASGPVRGTNESYPEYKQFEENNPTGYLAGDQRHRLNAWVGYDLPTSFGNFNFSVLQAFNSGQAYDAVGAVNVNAYVTNPGYARLPAPVNYYFSGRGEFRTEDVWRTDLALNYSVRVFKSVELFLQPEVLNVFNEDALIGGRIGTDMNVTVNTRANQTGFLTFNPFTETPVRGARNVASPSAHYDLGPNFGRAVGFRAYQLPRTYRFSVGARF